MTKTFIPDVDKKLLREKPEPNNLWELKFASYQHYVNSLRELPAPWLEEKHRGKEMRLVFCNDHYKKYYALIDDAVIAGVDEFGIFENWGASGTFVCRLSKSDLPTCKVPIVIATNNPDLHNYLPTLPDIEFSPAEPPADKVWPLLGYAPGHYCNHCANCGKEMNNVDKLCFQCLECAVIAANRIMASVPPAGEGKGEDFAFEFEKYPELAKEIEWFANHVGAPGSRWNNLLHQINKALQSQSSPTYPAGFVDPDPDFTLWVVVNKWRYDHTSHRWYTHFVREMEERALTHSELYKEYLKTLK